MLETHPFGDFAPPGASYLLLGSFTTKEAFDERGKESYEWFYSNGRNQFWPILEVVYGIRLQTREEMQRLFTTLGMAIADIIYQCERKNSSNLDINLTSIVYNTEGVRKILAENPIKRVYFSSRFVEARFRRLFGKTLGKDLELVTLPSPSPRYAQMSLKMKIKRYSELLPPLFRSVGTDGI